MEKVWNTTAGKIEEQVNAYIQGGLNQVNNSSLSGLQTDLTKLKQRINTLEDLEEDPDKWPETYVTVDMLEAKINILQESYTINLRLEKTARQELDHKVTESVKCPPVAELCPCISDLKNQMQTTGTKLFILTKKMNKMEKIQGQREPLNKLRMVRKCQESVPPARFLE